MGEVTSLFIDASTSTGPFLPGRYNPWLVVLSLLVSIFSATMALQTAQIARGNDNPLYRHVAIGTGAIALGIGIWTMHFIGMLAFELPAHVHYSTSITLLSLLPAIAASWLALRMLASPRTNWPQLIMSGTLVGLGIGTMHYSGMAAMHTPLQMRYEPVTFALSIVVAAGMAILSLWVRYGLRHTSLGPTQRLLASGHVMGLAIAGMHYTGMAATRFIGEPGSAAPGMTIDTSQASVALSIFTVMATVLVYAVNGLVRSRELYRRVEESQSRLRATLDTAVDGIITFDGGGLIRSFNQSAERLYGWRADEVIDRSLKVLMPVSDQLRQDNTMRNYLATATPNTPGVINEVISRRKDNTLMPTRLAVGRVDLPDEVLFVGFVTDISERHAMEISLRETAERAERAAAAKSTFLANMSHEMRTPMNSVIGFTELMLQGNLTSTQRNHLNTIRQSSRSLLGLINDILDTTRMEKGSLPLERIDFSLKALAFQIESSLRLSAQAKHLTLTTHYPDAMPEYFQGDPLRVLQILTNLIGNAIKFTERGGVDVHFAHTEGGVQIAVRDSGIGMTLQQIENIFAPFTQADASISRRFGGTGLGTTIARQLAELMGGDIRVESEHGRGSTFHIRLPLPIGQQQATQHDVNLPVLPPLRILIADDVPQNIELLTFTLTQAGHRIVSASDGEAAVDKFIAGLFDLVLMDVHMPGIDGLQATRLIRQHERVNGLRCTPVIALTASVMNEDRHAALQAGMDGFAMKPLDLPRLFDEIAQVLNLQSSPITRERKNRSDRPATLIDWPAGIALWGSEARMRKGLELFLTTTPTSHPLLAADSNEIDWAQLIFNLHSIRGAAANLALPSVTALAGKLEEQLRAGVRDDAQPQLTELQRLLNAVEQELHSGVVRAPLATGESTAAAPASPELLSEMRNLLAFLLHNELDDAALDTVCSALEQQGEYTQAQTLRSAVESFEFAEAHALLQRLIDSAATETGTGTGTESAKHATHE